MDVKELIQSKPALQRALSATPERLINQIIVRSCHSGFTLTEKDEEIVNVYVLCEGRLGVVNQFPSGHSYFFAEQTAINFSGEIEVISGNEGYACRNETLSECTFLVIKKEVFKEIFDTNIEFTKFVAEIMARKIYPRSYFSGRDIIYPLEYNLIVYLLNYASQNKANSKVVVRETRQIIADRLGVNVRSVNRRVKEMARLDQIGVEKGKIVLTNEHIVGLEAALLEFD